MPAVNNVIHSDNGKLYAGMTKESIRADIDAMAFKSEKEREKAYNQQIKIFDYANSLIKDEIDDKITEREIEAYNKKEKTKKIIKNAGLITIGVGIAIAGAILAKNVMTANRLKQQKSVLQIIEDFKPAETLEEAKLRAIKQYGLKDFDMMDLNCANDALCSLELIKNKNPGPLKIKKIIEESSLQSGILPAAGLMYCDTGVMKISRESYFHMLSYKQEMLLRQIPTDKMDEYWKLANNIHSEIELAKVAAKFGIEPKNLYCLPFETFLHEYGHRVHYLTVGKEKFRLMGKLDELWRLDIKNYSIYNGFMTKEVQKIIDNCPFLGKSAKESPAEFVANVYVALIHDIKLPEEVMALYKKYNRQKVL